MLHLARDSPFRPFAKQFFTLSIQVQDFPRFLLRFEAQSLHNRMVSLNVCPRVFLFVGAKPKLKSSQVTSHRKLCIQILS